MAARGALCAYGLQARVVKRVSGMQWVPSTWPLREAIPCGGQLPTGTDPPRGLTPNKGAFIAHGDATGFCEGSGFLGFGVSVMGRKIFTDVSVT